MTDTLARLENALSDRYRLERELGQGGMATVYLAEDLKHGRKVAIKVLHPELSAVIGGDRFLAEIRVTANLQHAHILGLIDSGEADGLLYYVMPYVAGESLRNRLNRDKQLPVEEAVRLAREVASALDYAHRHGVVHRDIKPENILLQEGSALVADFGIALAVQQAGGNRMTQTGMSLGTPAYMSPEQAMGERDIGARSDVYALGAMTYEMLTGEPPFTGPNSQAIVAKVLTESPQPVRPKRPTVSSAVEHAVLTSLQKLPADRFGTAKEFGDALDAKGTYAPTEAIAAARLPHPPGLSRRAAFAAIVAMAIVAAFAGWLLRGKPRAIPPARFALVIPATQRVTPWAEPGSSISADGQLLLYNVDVAGVTGVYARRLTDPVGSPIPGSDGAVGPVLSPDSDWFIYTNAAHSIWRKMPVQGGASIEIPMPRGISVAVMRWNGTDGYAITLSSGEIALLHAAGALDTLAAPDTARQEQSLEIMEVLPNGNLLAIATDLWPAGHVVIIDARTGARTEVHSAPTSWASTSGGDLVWADPVGVLFASPFDGKHVTGPARSLGAQAQTTRGGRPKVSAARNAGDLAYIPVQPASLARVGRDGRAQTLLASPRTYHNPRVSPDGRTVSLDISETERDVWLLDLSDTTLSRVSFEGSGHDAIFTPDGQSIVFAVARGNIIGAFIRRLDGAGSTDSVLTAGSQYSIHTITPDGRIGIGVKTTGVSTSGFDLVSVPLVGSDRKASTVLESRYMEGFPALSPDGRWLAYASDESGRAEVYVRPWPGPGPKVVISQHGGIEPIWSRDGRELFYRGPSNGMPFLIAAAIETQPTFRVASRTPLFDDADYETSTPHANYDVMPDGSFIMVRLARASEFTYLQNWPALMQQQASRGAP